MILEGTMFHRVSLCIIKIFKEDLIIAIFDYALISHYIIDLFECSLKDFLLNDSLSFYTCPITREGRKMICETATVRKEKKRKRTVCH